MLNEQTFEFSQARLKLKDSLRFTMRQGGDAVHFLVEDEVTGRFFRVGLPQYTFLSMMDGQRTVSTALMKTATLLREHAIDESEAANLCKWAIESGLVESENGNSTARRVEQHEQQQKQKMVSYLNPMMMRIPLFNPDPIVTVITRFLGFLVSPVGAIIWLTVCLFGFLKLANDWDAFYLNRVNSFGATDIAWIAVTWILLKLVHEIAHSVVCKKFGGRVQSCGILLLLMIPMPYVDVTSSWRFENKWKRILTSAAGMMSEIFIAAIACWVWVTSEPGPLQFHAGNVIISATLHTLLFNINPLMRFDGYYMLSDWLEIPNLASQGRTWLKGKFKRLYFGNKPAELKETGLRGLAVRAYGVLAMAWFFTIAIGLSLAASSFIEGFGLIVAIIGMILWAGMPLYKLINYTAFGTDTEIPNRAWFATAMACTLVLVSGFLYLCPSPSVVSAPVVIDYEPLSIVRANSKGFARSIHVVNGQAVEEGDLLVTLENLDLEHELHSLSIDINISELRSNNLFNAGEISQVQLERESLESMLKQKKDLEDRIADLTILAPQSGVVLARDLESSIGKHFVPGDELLSIARPGEIHAIALTRQTDIEWVGETPNAEVELLVWGRHEGDLLKGRIKHVEPRARDDMPHEAFAAIAGGPLAVVPRGQVEDDGAESGDMMLTEPRVPIEIELDPSDREKLIAGQTGKLIVRSREQNMGGYLAQNFIQFVRQNNFRTHGL